ncbi:MAG TPA: CYTH domain-containing protein, partial [Ktedonobacteraceae bacterium]
PRLEKMHLQEEKVCQDVYYDTLDYDLLCHQQCVFVRLREGRLLQFKFDLNSEQQCACIEREFPLQGDVPEKAQALFQTFLPEWQPAPTWEQAMTANQLVELARIEKRRSIYIDGPLIISIDRVEGLGDFVEIERNCREQNDADIQAARAQVHTFLQEIGGIPLKAGYFEMWLYRHNQSAYQLVPQRFRVEDTLIHFP